jgi:hypothetical protein
MIDEAKPKSMGLYDRKKELQTEWLLAMEPEKVRKRFRILEERLSWPIEKLDKWCRDRGEWGVDTERHLGSHAFIISELEFLADALGDGVRRETARRLSVDLRNRIEERQSWLSGKEDERRRQIQERIEAGIGSLTAKDARCRRRRHLSSVPLSAGDRRLLAGLLYMVANQYYDILSHHDNTDDLTIRYELLAAQSAIDAEYAQDETLALPITRAERHLREIGDLTRGYFIDDEEFDECGIFLDRLHALCGQGRERLRECQAVAA